VHLLRLTSQKVFDHHERALPILHRDKLYIKDHLLTSRSVFSVPTPIIYAKVNIAE
jgi:hypothetical protein